MVTFGVILVVGGLAFWWLRTIVEVANIPEEHFREAGTEKITWLLIVMFLGIVGTMIWYGQFWRGRVLRVARQKPSHR